MSDETTDVVRRINESGNTIKTTTKFKRGSGTRDQDEIKIKVEGNDPEEVVDKLNATIVELQETASTVRNIQPVVEGDEDDEDDE